MPQRCLVPSVPGSRTGFPAQTDSTLRIWRCLREKPALLRRPSTTDPLDLAVWGEPLPPTFLLCLQLLWQSPLTWLQQSNQKLTLKLDLPLSHAPGWSFRDQDQFLNGVQPPPPCPAPWEHPRHRSHILLPLKPYRQLLQAVEAVTGFKDVDRSASWLRHPWKPAAEQPAGLVQVLPSLGEALKNCFFNFPTIKICSS